MVYISFKDLFLPISIIDFYLNELTIRFTQVIKVYKETSFPFGENFYESY